ncbi:unnamed protein product [Rangifer tarandus platyrhynchus]|uniref:Uncharacterized protein n=1 Tax=Rangifer tarandus platyrhynchus TaxID=3082113 RepID=A0ABN9A054_RANTA|nr:unnamed protein product [Rangifer tarandus platyrhynchus]
MSPRHRHPVLNTAETHTHQCGWVRKALTRLTRNDSEFQDSTERLQGREAGGFFSHLFSWLCFFVFCSFPLLRKAHQRSLVDFGEEQPPASRKSDGAQFPDCAAVDPGECPPRPEGHGPRSPTSPLMPPRPGRGGAGRPALGLVVIGFCFFVLFFLVPEKPRRATLLFQSGSAVPERCSRSASTGPREPGRGPRPPAPLIPTSSFLPRAPPPPRSLPSPSLPLHSPRLLPASACGLRTVSSSHPVLLSLLPLPPLPRPASSPHFLPPQPDLLFSNFLASSPPLLLPLRPPSPSSSHPSSPVSTPPAPQGCGRLPGVGRSTHARAEGVPQAPNLEFGWAEGAGPARCPGPPSSPARPRPESRAAHFRDDSALDVEHGLKGGNRKHTWFSRALPQFLFRRFQDTAKDGFCFSCCFYFYLISTRT